MSRKLMLSSSCLYANAESKLQLLFESNSSTEINIFGFGVLFTSHFWMILFDTRRFDTKPFFFNWNIPSRSMNNAVFNSFNFSHAF